jgi:hypothetical protein
MGKDKEFGSDDAMLSDSGYQFGGFSREHAAQNEFESSSVMAKHSDKKFAF